MEGATVVAIMAVINKVKRAYWNLAKLGRDFHRDIRSRQALRAGAVNAHFLHINKAAGSAVKEALFPYRLTPKYVLSLHVHATTLRDVPVGDKFFFFLRDPVSRFVSGFDHRLNKGRPKYFTEWSAAEARVFEVFQSADSLALGLSSDDAARRELAEFGMRHIFHVRSSFYDWFESDAYFDSRRDDLLFIGFQETVERDFAYLAKVLGLSGEFRLPSDGVMSNRSMSFRKPHQMARRGLSEPAIDNLRHWYAADFHFYQKCAALAPRLWPE